jgi:hypothetical protein
MLNLRDKALLMLCSLSIIVGILKAFIIPLFLAATSPELLEESSMAYVVNSIVHGFVLVSWMLMLARGNLPERRLISKNWIFYGVILILVGVITPVFWTIMIKYQDGLLLTEAIIETVYELSETSFYAIGYGLGFAIFKLEENKLLMRFHIPLAFLWIIGPLPSSVLFHLGVQFSGEFAGPHLFYPDAGPPIWIFPYCLFDAWFWADQVVDYPLALILLIANWRLQFRNHSSDKVIAY